MTHQPVSHAFERAARIRVNVLRAPTLVGGRRGEEQLHLTNIPATPLEPVSVEIAMRVVLQTPHEVWQCFVGGDYEIREGDVLVVARPADANGRGKKMPIRAVETVPWEDGQDVTMTRRLVVEELKTEGRLS